MLSIQYRLIYALWPCTKICFPELQSFQQKKCYLLKREHSSIDFSYRFLNDGDDNIWQLSVGANIDAYHSSLSAWELSNPLSKLDSIASNLPPAIQFKSKNIQTEKYSDLTYVQYS